VNRLGRVAALWRHPVKGMRGERVSEAELKWAGVAGDRRYAFVRADDPSNFPWLTPRMLPALLRYLPRFEDPTRPRASRVRVRTPGGGDLAVDDPALREELAEQYGGPLSLLHSARGLHDSEPVSLLGQPTIERLCADAAVPAEPRRFRANLVVVGERGEPFEEEAWLGRTLTVGAGPDAPQLRLDRKIERCVVITLDPDTAQPEHELLISLATQRDACVGLYASVVKPGLLREGAEIFEG